MTREFLPVNSDKVMRIHPIKVIFILMLTAIGTIYLYQQSFKSYWQQSYHIDLTNLRALFSIDAESSNLNADLQKTADLPSSKQDAQAGKRELSVTQVKQRLIKPIKLSQKEMVFFAGDSLMQGIAPYAKKLLYKKYRIESIDLSKQNTGLIYPAVFDWPKTIDETLTNNPSIKLLVMFLGPNDPWKFPIKKANRYAEFRTPEWEEHYRFRIQKILHSAQQHGVEVLWLAAPCMRRHKLNDDIIYLNSLYQSETEKSSQHFLTTNDLLGCTYDKFRDFVETEKEKIKMRLDDGIHFSGAGQKILASAIVERISVN